MSDCPPIIRDGRYSGILIHYRIMAVNSNSTLDELRTWWKQENCLLQSEFYIEASSMNDVKVFLDFDPTLMKPLFLELPGGMPVITARPTPTPEYSLDMGVNAFPGQTKSFPPAVEKRILAYIKDNVSEVEAKLTQEVCRKEEADMMTVGTDFRMALINALCSEVILDEKSVTPSYMYCASRFLSPEALDDIRKDVLRKTRSFLGEQLEKGVLSRDEFKRLHAFHKKSIADKFHPWTFLKGKLNHRLGNIGYILEGVRPREVSLVAQWAVSDTSYAPYLALIDDWISAKAKAFDLSRKDIDAILSNSGTLQTIQKGINSHRPKLPDPVVKKARREFAQKI